MGEICDYGKCINVDIKELKPEDWILDLEDIEKESGKIIKIITFSERKSESTKHKFFKGQVLYSKLRPYLNKVVIAPKDGFCTSEILPLDFKMVLISKYAQCLLMSSHFLSTVNMLTYGVKMPRLGTEDAKKLLLPIPPKNEQKNIVNSLEQIFTQINLLENDNKELQTSIKQAKSKILDLAIHGKLVPQNPTDEPAEELLKRIATSDNRPYKKFDENESEINIPTGWFLCKLKDVCTDFIVPQRDKPKVFDGNIPWCRIEDIEGKYLNGSLSGQLVTEETIQKMNMHKCPVGSIICSCSASLGIQAITTVECCTNQTFIGIVPNNSALFNEYLYYLLKAQTKYFHEIATGTTIKYISRDKFEELLVVLPPLQEQHRIVAKIEALFSQLDTISEQLS